MFLKAYRLKSPSYSHRQKTNTGFKINMSGYIGHDDAQQNDSAPIVIN